MKKIKLLIFLCFILFSVIRQPADCSAQSNTFQVSYDYDMMDIFTGIDTATNGYVISGPVNTFPLPSITIKVDTATGTVLWARRYRDGSFIPTIPLFTNDMQKTSDGGFIYTGGFGSYAMLLKTNFDGSAVNFSRRIGASPNEFGNAVKQTSDGGYVVAGITSAKSINTNKDSASVYVFKTNNTGTFSWGRSYTLTSPVFDDDDAANDVAEVSDGYVFVGTQAQNNGADTTANIILFKTDFTGVLQWMKSIGELGQNEGGYSIKALSSGELLLVGYTDKTVSGVDASDVAIIKTDASGNINFSSSYDMGFADEPRSIQRTSDGGYSVIGWAITNLFPLTIKSFLLKLDASFDVQFAEHYNSMIGGIFSKGKQISSNGYVIGSMVGNVNYDLHLIKTNPAGISGCNETSYSSVKKVYTPPSAAIIPTVFTGGSASNFTVNNSSITPIRNPVCVICTPPVTGISATTNPVCAGNSTTITATGGGTYLWDTGPTTAAITVSPLTTTTYTVTVTNNGCTASTALTITVNALPTISVNPPAPAICTGNSVVLTASGANTYSWAPAGGLSTTTGATVIANPGSTTTYTVTGTGSNGCSNTTSVTVTVNSVPTVSVSPPAPAICAGDTVLLTAGGADTYTWSPASGLDATTGTTVNAFPSSTTTYTVTGTVSGGCTNTTTVLVTINQLPNINLGPDVTICTGDSIQLNASGGTSYLWSPSIGLSCTNCPDPFANPAATSTYYVTVTNAAGCSNIDTIIVNVQSALVADAGSDVSICPGDSTQLNGSGGASYAWSPASGLSCVNCQNPIATPSSTTTYTVIVSSGNCTPATDQITVTILPAPNANAGADVSICTGDSTTLTASGGTSYNWAPGTGLSCTNCASPVATPTSTTSYTVTVSDGTCTATDAVIVTVNSFPVALISGNTSICIGSTTTLTATGGATYLWSTSDTTSSITPVITSGGTYSVTVSNGACSDTASITVNTLVPPIANAGSDTTIFIGGSAQLHGSGGVTYSWSPNTALSCSNCADPLASPLSTTTYVLIVTDTNGCTDADTVIVYIDMECGEIFVPNAFSPNKNGPIENELECVYGNCIKTLNFAIYDRWGEKVFETTNPKECWDGRYKGKELNTGVFVYYVKYTLYNNGTEITKQGNISLVR